MISVSIIVPAWNEEKTLRATLEGILETDYDKEKCEVLVIGGGDDRTYEIAGDLSTTMGAFSRYVVILQEHKGKNAAIQQGMKQASNDVIVLLDADTLVSKQWLKNMVDPIELGSCDLTIANPEPVRKNWVSDYYMVTKAYSLDSITTYSGHSMAFKAGSVEGRVKYFFDEDVKVGVDYLLAKRFLEQGLKIMFARDARVITHLPSSLRYFALCELRWLTALINIEGISYRTLACNATVVGTLIFALPLSKTLFTLALLFHSLYILNKIRMFFVASRHHNTSIRNLFGFIMLSYAYHVVGFISHIKYFLGVSEESYLYQGERY